MNILKSLELVFEIGNFANLKSRMNSIFFFCKLRKKKKFTSMSLVGKSIRCYFWFLFYFFIIYFSGLGSRNCVP